jgi:2-amino-4-hydroxy-6-hydroxymethyldihydropteridine diphosphokinase
MTDRILIQDLLLRTIIGINPEERRKRQDVVINAVLYVDIRAAGASDDIEDAVNYKTITKQIIQLVEGSEFYLVEKLASEIAAVCLADPGIERATVRVEKPGALRFSRSVGIEIDRSRDDLEPASRVFISLGSNIDPEDNLPAAVRRLDECSRLLAVSRVYQTKPVGTTDQPDFLNAAVLIETHLAPVELKSQVLQRIECELGRVRTQDVNAPRTIDLDISLVNRDVLELDGRHIPDPDGLRYAHVARPLADLVPAYVHPETGQTLLEIAGSLPEDNLEHRPDLVLWPAV